MIQYEKDVSVVNLEEVGMWEHCFLHCLYVELDFMVEKLEKLSSCIYFILFYFFRGLLFPPQVNLHKDASVSQICLRSWTTYWP